MIGTVTYDGATSFVQWSSAISKMSEKQLANLLITNNQTLGIRELNSKQMYRALTEAGVSDKVAEATVKQVFQTQATKAQTTANGELTTSSGGVLKALKGLWATNKWALIIAGVTIAIKALKWADEKLCITLDAQRKKTQKLRDEYNTLSQEVQSLEGELTSIKQRIQEIKALDNPTFTDEQELKRLEKQVELLTRQKELKEDEANKKASKVTASVQSEYDRQYKTVGELTGMNTYHSLYDFVEYDARGYKTKVGKAISGEQYFEELIRKVKELNDLKDSTSAKDWVGSANEQALADYSARLQDMSDEFGSLATKIEGTDEASVALFDSLYEQSQLAKAVSEGDYWSFLLNRAGKDNIQEQADALKGLADSLQSSASIEETAQAAQKLKDILSQDTGISNMVTQAEGLGYAAEGSLSALTAWDGTLEGMTSEAAEAANAIGQLIAWLFEVQAASGDGDTPAINTLKEALDGLSDETAVLREAMAKLSKGNLDKWLTNNDNENLKSLLDKFPDLRDELDKYADGLIDTEKLQRAFNSAMQDFNTDAIYNGINDVVSAYDTYGASSNQVLQAVQNLDKFIPGLVDKLYKTENGHLIVASGASFSAAAIYSAAKETLELKKVTAETKFDDFVGQADSVTDALMRMGGTAAIAVGGLNPYMAAKTEKDNYLSELDSLLGALESAYKHIQNTGSKKTEVYVPDVDPLYQYLQTVEDINDELDRFDIDEKLLDEDDFEGKNTLIEKRIQKLEDLKTALHDLNNARDVEITTAVDKLNGYGSFQATYDKDSGQALINNMDALKGLTGDTAKAAEALISAIEDGSKSAIATSNEYMEAQVEINNLLKEQIENNEKLREQAADDRIDRLKNQIDLLSKHQEGFEGNLDFQGAVQSLKQQKDYWEEVKRIANEKADEIRAMEGFDPDSDEWREKIQHWRDIWWEADSSINEANSKIVEDSLARLDSFIEQADNFNWWDNIDTTKVDMLEKKLETIHQLYADGIIPDAATYKKLVDETAKEIYDEKLSAIEQVIDYTKKLIEEEVRLRKEELEEQVDDYKKIVDLKKESLRASKEEADYQKSVADKTKSIAQLQQQINTLSLSDDRRDIAVRKKLEEELAELQGELADTQADHTLEAQEKALDDSYDAFDREKSDEVKKLEATIDTEGKLYALAIERIDRDWDALYSDLMNMNSLYWDGIAGESGIKGAWDTAKKAAEGYFGVLEAKQGIEKEQASVSGAGTSVGSSVLKDSTVAYFTGDIDKQKQLQAIGAKMQTNSQLWHVAHNANDQDKMDDLVAENQQLARDIYDLTGVAPVFNPDDGYWHLGSKNGDIFYKIYHGGGIVGSDEEFAKLQKGELVVPKNQVEPTMKLLEWGNTLASKMRGLFSGNRLVSSAMSDAITGTPPSPAAGAIVNNTPSVSFNVPVEVKYDSSASPADAKRFGEHVVDGITEAFHRKGIGTSAKPLGITI